MAKQQPQNNLFCETKKLVAASYFEGPLPPPEVFAKYESICPGAADRILRMAERQAEHRQELEKKIVKANSRDGLLGVIFALIIVIFALICGTIVSINGLPWAGSFIGAAGLSSVVGAFIYGTRNQNKNNQKK